MKDDFSISIINKAQAASVLKYHYLSDPTNGSKGFKSGINYGLFYKKSVVGVVIYTGFPVPELCKGMFGLERSNQSGLFELSRLCILPHTQSTEHNITSWFVARSIKKLKKEFSVRCILSYADSKFHKGVIYRACNFKYYGLTSKKSDFWLLQDDGTYIKHSRGKTKHVAGKWLPRTRKHRFVLIFDDSLKMRWKEKC